jgi:hypothetical protein
MEITGDILLFSYRDSDKYADDYLHLAKHVIGDVIDDHIKNAPFGGMFLSAVEPVRNVNNLFRTNIEDIIGSITSIFDIEIKESEGVKYCLGRYKGKLLKNNSKRLVSIDDSTTILNLIFTIDSFDKEGVNILNCCIIPRNKVPFKKPFNDKEEINSYCDSQIGEIEIIELSRDSDTGFIYSGNYMGETVLANDTPFATEPVYHASNSIENLEKILLLSMKNKLALYERYHRARMENQKGG